MPQTAEECRAELRGWIASGAARKLREDADLSRLEAANELHVWPSTLARWESGERSPKGHHALSYHKLLARLAASGNL